MTTKRLFKWLAGMALIATTAGALSACYVDTGHPYYHPHYHYYRY